MESARLQTIQVLRAIAALSVFFAHLIGDIAQRHTGFQLVPMYYLGAAGVDLFFVISGFVMTYSTHAALGDPGYWRTFLRARVARVVPLYWLVIVLYAAVQALKGNWSVLRAGDILRSAFFIPYPSADGTMVAFYGIGWTLNFEMFFYVVFTLAILVFGRSAAIAVGVGLMSGCLVGGLFELPMLLAYWSNSMVLEFALGIAIALLYRSGFRLNPLIAGLLGLTALGCVLLGGLLGYNSVLPDIATTPPRWIAWGLPCAMIVAAVALFGRQTKPLPGLLIRLGDSSYSIYLLHPLIIIACRPLLQMLLGASGGAVTLCVMIYACVVSIAVTTLAILSFRLFESPLNNALRGSGSQSRVISVSSGP